MRSSTGENAAALFAVVELSQLILNLDKLERHARAVPLIGIIVAATALAFVLALAVAGRRAAVLMSIVGLGSGLVNAYAENGSTGVLLLLVATALFLWLFGFGRGVLR